MFRPFRFMPPPWHVRRPRTLSLEYLESRLVLSGLPEVVPPPPEFMAEIPADESLTVAVTSVVVDGNTPPAIAEGPVPDSLPLPTTASPVSSASLVNDTDQPAVGATVSTLGQTLSPPGGSSAPGLAPTIVDFTASLENGYWRLRGSVLDDASTAGLTVYFAGIIRGQVITDANGVFDFRVADSDVGIGWVIAHTVDVDGRTSDYELVTIDV